MNDNHIKLQSSNAHQLILANEMKNKSKYENDLRLDNMTAIFQSMIFLRDEAQKNGDEDISELINGAFRMMLLAHDIISKGEKNN